MPTTLLTGANGFVAAHILSSLISEGHTVIGSVRSLSKGDAILSTHPEWKDHVKFVVVSDYAKEGTWDQVFEENEIDYVVHSAAPLLDGEGNVDFERDFLKPSVGGALEILESASKYGKNVKAIAVTGSVNAMTTGMDIADRKFNSDSWLPLTIADAIQAQHAYISYCVAKAESDKAIWKYIADNKPHYTVSVLLPALIFGPPIHPITDIKNINYSTNVFYSLINGTYEVVPDTSFPSYIDVRDLATAHILSLTTPAVANKRFLVGGHQYSSQIAVNALKTVPELEGRLPKDGEEVEKVVVFEDVAEWNEKLGLKLRTAEQTFGDAARRMLELEKIML